MIALLLAGALQAAATAAPILQPTERQESDIVVTARPLAESEKRWRDCMARHCPADQEIAAALAHGENLFVAGEYEQARRILHRTMRHVAGAAGAFPTQVADIRRAEARIAAHLGHGDLVRRGMLSSLDALSDAFGPDDPRVLGQRIEAGDALILDGRPDGAMVVYDNVANRAHRVGQFAIEGAALLRRASLLVRQEEETPGVYRDAAMQAVRRIAATTEPALAQYRSVAAILMARLSAAGGDETAIDRLMATLRERPTAHPVLVYAPPVKWVEPVGQGTFRQVQTEASDPTMQNQWIDIGFRVRPDGRIGDVEVLRRGDKTQSFWIEPVLASVRGRRYLPLTADATGTYRVERQSRTAAWVGETGSGIPVQSGPQRIMVMDLTDEAARR